MRNLAFVAVALVLGATPAAAWEEYLYPDDQFAIQFPAEPEIETRVYETALVPARPSTVYSVEHDNILYVITVVDFSDRVRDGANFVGEIAYALMREGEVIFYDFPRVDRLENAIYGIGMVVDRNDGSRLRSSIYFTGGRLYRADAIVLPARGDKDMSIASRFDQTLRFALDAF